MSAFISDMFPTKDRLRGAVGTTANTDTLIYTHPAGADIIRVEDVLLNCAGGTTRTVDAGLVASGETYADGTYDIATALSVAAAAPISGANTSGTKFCPFYMKAGDSLHLLASGAGIRYQVNFGKPRTQNTNVGGF